MTGVERFHKHLTKLGSSIHEAPSLLAVAAAAAVEEAVKEERERCAKIAEDLRTDPNVPDFAGMNWAAVEIAERIREGK